MAPTLDLTSRETYRYWSQEIVRFSDIDRYGHVNNVAFAVYCESARVEFGEELWPGCTAGTGSGFVIARLIIDFKAQARYPGGVEVGTCVQRLGRTSFTIGQGLFKDGVCFATAESVLVWVDMDSGRSQPLPPDLLAKLQDYIPAGAAP